MLMKGSRRLDDRAREIRDEAYEQSILAMAATRRGSVTTVEVSQQLGIALAEADTCCAPGYTAVTLANTSTQAPAFLFIADETPLHTKLGVFEVRD